MYKIRLLRTGFPEVIMDQWKLLRSSSGGTDMLTIFSGAGHKTCDGLSRRDFLRIGTLGLGGLTLPQLLQARAAAAATGRQYVHDKAVVLLFLSGGASHIETFDPKMDAPAEIRSMTGAVQTSLPGVAFGGTFPLLARQAHRMALVRSFSHTIGGHVEAIVHLLTGGTDPTGKGQAGFSMGSLYSRLRGTNHPVTGLPTYTLLTADEVDQQYRNERSRMAKGSRPGMLGATFGPFDPISGGGTAAQNMSLSIPAERFEDRMNLLQQFDDLNRVVDTRGGAENADPFQQQAMNLILGGGAVRAMDVSREDRRLLERYDTSHIQIGHRTFRPSTLGRQMLMARRLIEAGCGFVTVHSAGWDMHNDSNNPGIEFGMNRLGRSVDRAVSAFLEDVEQRGLSDKILFVLTGDFGRTPRINRRGGRDHWTRLCTLAFAGGGLNMGQEVGRSGRHADVPTTTPISPTQMMGTIIHTLFDVGQIRLQADIPRDLSALAEQATPIAELF